MTVELADRTEQFREMEERTGRLAEDLVREAIDVLHARQLRPQPWPKSIGMSSDGGVDADEFEDWLAAEYERDWRESERQNER